MESMGTTKNNMTPTAWAHLPNAKHIDRILAGIKKNPDKWASAWNAAWSAAWDDAARGVSLDTAKYIIWESVWITTQGAARSAIFALIAYDDCAYLLDEKPEEVKLLGLLGNEKAILLYPACLALQKETA